MNEKSISRFEKLFPVFDGFSMDLLFLIAVDTLFYTYVKHFTPAQIVSLTSVSLVTCIVLYYPMLRIIRRMGNTASFRLGAGLLMGAAVLITVGPNFLTVAVGKVLYEMGHTFRSMIHVTLRKNLDLHGRGDRYIVLRSRANTIYSAVTMVIAFVAGPMYNLNPYFPMLGCIFFTVCCFTLSFFLRQEQGVAADVKKEKRKIQWSAVTLLSVAAYAAYFSIVTAAQVDGKLFIQNDLSEFFGADGEARVVTLITGMVAVSRVIRTGSNLLFAPVYRKLGDRVGVGLCALLLAAVVLEVAGHLLDAGIYLRFIIMGLGYNFILFLRDPFKIYIQDVYLKHLRQEDMESAMMLMELMRKIFHTALAFFFARLLTKYELISEMTILCFFGAAETVLGIVLFAKLKKEKRVKA